MWELSNFFPLISAGSMKSRFMNVTLGSKELTEYVFVFLA